ncbi:MAG TPA: hypothetical protein VHL31_10020 [Geminicoccus sp.]|jgi:hypothetical protein|uniref:ROK family protein n=1 Tax=Geminicoccus sp. TaxID=2024832 RepID=UPI002E301D13|nr:hypothetical protein [Geminicoccus sp.]HEX2526616.1 hypothetical protein [Geminicoccus sp.]
MTQDAAPRRFNADPQHGAKDLRLVRVDTYNAELEDPTGKGFLGDRASNRSFIAMLEDWRVRVRRGNNGVDPLEGTVGEGTPTHQIDRGELDDLLQAADEDPEAAGLVHSAIEEFAHEMAGVVRRFLRLPAWQGTERIAVGGGFLEARVGLMAIGRVGILLKAQGEPIQITPVSRHPDEAGLCGAVHLAPPAVLEGRNAILAVDIGGTNMRVGLIGLGPAQDGSGARVLASERWRHADEHPDRNDAVARLAEMLRGLAGQADQERLRLAPFVGIGCPGVISADGTIERGGQNLPGGGWEGAGFNLPARLQEALPDIAGRRPHIVVHNDAVVQGLSEAHRMRDVRHWGALTVGTGLGNARFSNRVQQAA